MSSTSWVRRAGSKGAKVFGGAVVVLALGPSLANAAGADLPDPVVTVVRSSGERLSDVVTTADTRTRPAVQSPGDTETAATHGQIVSRVAHCAPRGKDPLFAVVGEAMRTHGDFTSAAAHGETVTLAIGTFDLSTEAGADALCAALEKARAELPPALQRRPPKTKPGRPEHAGSGREKSAKPRAPGSGARRAPGQPGR